MGVAVKGSQLSLRDWLPRRRYVVLGEVSAADEVPARLPRKGVVLVVPKPGHPTWASFDCPCRRRHRLLINVDSSRKPYWRVTSKPVFALVPSIDAHEDGIRCHFVMRAGRPRWAHDSDHERIQP